MGLEVDMMQLAAGLLILGVILWGISDVIDPKNRYHPR